MKGFIWECLKLCEFSCGGAKFSRGVILPFCDVTDYHPFTTRMLLFEKKAVK